MFKGPATKAHDHVLGSALGSFFVVVLGVFLLLFLRSLRAEAGLPNYKGLQWNIQELVTMVSYREHLP